ncbi:MAG: hypothetical protein U0790_29780, partial [Isosphaeraceae bacterium]
MGPDRVGEASVDMFACYLGRATAIHPARFARLALRMPVDSNYRYVVSILRAFADYDPARSGPETPTDELATINQIEAVIRRFAILEENREFAWAVCRANEQRNGAAWGDDTILMLSRLAIRHPDPDTGRCSDSHQMNTDGDGER